MNPPRLWPRRGEIWWVFIAGQPDDPHQPRPALVVSVDTRNQRSDDVIAVPFVSRGSLGPTRIPVPRGVGGLPNDSILFCEELTTVVHDDLAFGPLGPLVPDDLMARVVVGVLNAIAP
ncbi:MAG TPA: type II toxin-antitoxin system PemK/MazF family toxin [Acidimicrobiia bacterium]|nr:type II toxin-antitoxin system PemK/MazF family toxin [Acidimicrobiia bacterium]